MKRSSKIPDTDRRFGFGFIQPKFEEPTEQDLAFEKFRTLYPSTQVYVFENEMRYRNGSLQVAKDIIATHHLPLVASMEDTLTIRFINN